MKIVFSRPTSGSVVVGTIQLRVQSTRAANRVRKVSGNTVEQNHSHCCLPVKISPVVVGRIYRRAMRGVYRDLEPASLRAEDGFRVGCGRWCDCDKRRIDGSAALTSLVGVGFEQRPTVSYTRRWVRPGAKRGILREILCAAVKVPPKQCAESFSTPPMSVL